MENLRERIDFNFTYKDCSTMDKIFSEYINDRKALYEQIFLSPEGYTSQDIKDYIDYFCMAPTGSEEQDSNIHPNLPRIQHFLERKFSIFMMEKVEQIMNDLCEAMTNITCFYDVCEDCFDEFEEAEFNSIQKMSECWDSFMKTVMEYPLLNLDQMEYAPMGGVQVYYYKTIQPFVYKSFLSFLEDIKRDYPNTLLMMDTFLLVSPEYIEMCAGEGTQAFFTEDVIFYADSCKKEDKDFVQSVFYHEFGHYIYSLLSETMMEYWHERYLDWKNSGTQMTRDTDKNSQLDEFEEELFADTFSTLYIDNGEDAYIHKPSPIITDTLKFILEQEFTA